jgi:hypothetical protein
LYHSPHWPTADRVIPFRLFLLFSAQIAHLGAEEELRAGQASAYGQALAMGVGKDQALRRYTRRLARLAYPSAE